MSASPELTTYSIMHTLWTNAGIGGNFTDNKAFSKKIWQSCGSSYTSAAARQCRSKSYMANNMSYSYYVTIKGTTTYYHTTIDLGNGMYIYENNELVPENYFAVSRSSTTTGMITSVTPYGSPVTYNITYSKLNSSTRKYTINTAAQFTVNVSGQHTYYYTDEAADVKEKWDERSGRYKYDVTSDTLGNDTEQLTFRAKFTNVSASQNVNKYTAKVNTINNTSITNSFAHTYVPLNFTVGANRSTYTVSGTLTGLQSNGSTAGDPIPKAIEVTSKAGNTVSYIFSVTGKDALDHMTSNGFNVTLNHPMTVAFPTNELWPYPTRDIQFFFHNYDGTVVASSVFNVGFIKPVTDIMLINSSVTKLSYLYYTEVATVNVLPFESFVKDVVVTEANNKPFEYYYISEISSNKNLIIVFVKALQWTTTTKKYSLNISFKDHKDASTTFNVSARSFVFGFECVMLSHGTFSGEDSDTKPTANKEPFECAVFDVLPDNINSTNTIGQLAFKYEYMANNQLVSPDEPFTIDIKYQKYTDNNLENQYRIYYETNSSSSDKITNINAIPAQFNIIFSDDFTSNSRVTEIYLIGADENDELHIPVQWVVQGSSSTIIKRGTLYAKFISTQMKMIMEDDIYEPGMAAMYVTIKYTFSPYTIHTAVMGADSEQSTITH